MLLGYTKQFCCGFNWNYLHQRNWAKQYCLKFKSLNFNLFIELLLYKITLQSCRNILGTQCCIPKSYIIHFLFFTTAACIYTFLWVPLRSFVLISARVSHSLRLRKPHLARHKYIISRRKSDVKIDLLGIGILTGPGQSCRKPANSGPWPAERWISNYVYICWHWIFILL